MIRQQRLRKHYDQYKDKINKGQSSVGARRKIFYGNEALAKKGAKKPTFSQTAFNKFINNLQLSPHFTNINVGEIEANSDNDSGITFSIRADTKVIQKITTTQKAEEEVDLLDRTQGL